MAKFLFKFKKPIFGPFPQFWEQNKIFKKIGLSCTTSQWLLAPWQNPEKSNDPIPRKHPDVRKQGWTDPISWDSSSYRQGSSK